MCLPSTATRGLRGHPRPQCSMGSECTRRLMSEGPQLPAPIATGLRRLTIVTDDAALSRRDVYHLTHAFEVALPQLHTLTISARRHDRTRIPPTDLEA